MPSITKPQPGSDEWLKEHGIDPDVWAERGVWRYEVEDVDRVLDAVRSFITPKRGANPERSIAGQLLWVKRMVQQSPGLVIPKNAVPGLPPIAPQLRPDVAVITDPRGIRHRHGRWHPVLPTVSGKSLENHLNKGLTLEPDQRVPYDPKTGVGDHMGVDIEGVHYHAPQAAKYLFLPNVAQDRIDLHPRAAQLLPEADRVFFVLEGALKNDAVLSQGEAVFSVPSVTLWDPDELEGFAQQLRGKVVFVVPDADWYTNPLVDMQALHVRTLLRRAGVDAFVAAPPLFFPEKRDKSEKGIDDFLGHGYTVSDLEIRGKEVGRGVCHWRGHNLDYRTESRARRALEGLSLHADAHGRHRRDLGSLMGVMGLARGRRKALVPAVLDDLRDTYEILEGSLEIEPQEWDGKTIMVWKEQPIIELKDEYRAFEPPKTLLGDFWSREAYAMAKDAQERIARQEAYLAELRRGLEERGLPMPKLLGG